MGEATENAMKEEQSKNICNSCQEETDELLVCDRCGARVCINCFVVFDEESEGGLCTSCNYTVFASSD